MELVKCHYCNGEVTLEDSYYYYHPVCWDCLMDTKSKVLPENFCDNYCCDDGRELEALKIPITKVWGTPPLIKATEWCPACAKQQSWDHPVLEITSPKDVTTEMIEYVDQVAHLDERDRIDWEATIDRLDGIWGEGGFCSFFPQTYDHPVFEKLKREVRKLRKGPE